jgi:hypothetical protein
MHLLVVDYNTPNHLSTLLRDGVLKNFYSQSYQTQGNHRLLLVKRFTMIVVILKTEFWIKIYGLPKFFALIGQVPLHCHMKSTWIPSPCVYQCGIVMAMMWYWPYGLPTHNYDSTKPLIVIVKNFIPMGCNFHQLEVLTMIHYKNPLKIQLYSG